VVEQPGAWPAAFLCQHGDGTIRVLLVHDHDLTREDLRRILEDAADIEVACQAADADEARSAVQEHDPDVVVMDLATPGLGTFDAFKRSHAPHAETPLIILVAQPESVDAGRLLHSGALGCIAAQSAPSELIEAVRAVHGGRRYVCRHLKPALEGASASQHQALDFPGRLTNRERQVFRLLAAGRGTRQVAATLGLSRKTVSTHRAHILAKLRLHNNAELARFAMQHRLLDA
jgi:DNA-binding NarL/FixJ family response regulator